MPQREFSGDSFLPWLAEGSIKTWHSYRVYIVNGSTRKKKYLFLNCMTISSICQFSWYKYSPHGLFQDTNMRSLDTELGRDVQPAPAHHWPALTPHSPSPAVLPTCSDGIFHPELIVCDTHPEGVRILMLWQTKWVWILSLVNYAWKQTQAYHYICSPA